MKFKDIDKTDGLPNNALCVVKTTNNWNKSGVTIGVFTDGKFYDDSVLEEEYLEAEMWDISEYAVEYCYTGKCVKL